MTRQQTIDSLQIILDEKNNHLIIAMHAEALVKAIKVLSELSDNEFEYLTVEINHKGESMLIQFEHKKTNRTALFITTTPFFEGGQYSFKIEKSEDIPDFKWNDNFNMPLEIEKNEGKKGMNSYFKGFIDYPEIYYLEFLESAFPDNKIPID